MFARLFLVDVADSMGGQVDLSILLVRKLKLALIEPDVVLDEQQDFIRKIGGPESGREVDVF